MNRQARFTDRRGFTLVELLVVITIILLVSAVALPTVISAYTHRQVSEAARILQAGLVGSRDIAINNNAPAGIRLLPDPTLNGIDPSTGGAGALNPARILAANRFIPIQLAPDYSEGLVNLDIGPPAAAFFAYGTDPTVAFPYLLQKILSPTYAVPNGGYYPAATTSMLYLEQSVYNQDTVQMNPPTSWYWNIRIGDKVQLASTGINYTVVGPMTVFNPELFVNVGPPGTTPPLQQPDLSGSGTYNPEVLFLVNGLDDNNDGFVDNGFDGIDNDGDGVVDQVIDTLPFPQSEWVGVETEHWQSSILSRPTTARDRLLGWGAHDLAYSITRRPVVAPGARETALPSNVVIDLTTSFTTLERSRLPVDQNTGYVDILINPNGTVLPTTLYSSPSSFGMSSAFYHFWLAERTDLYDPLVQS